MVNPCCGFSLQKGTKVLAIIDIIQSGIGVFVFAIILLVGIFGSNEDADENANVVFPMIVIFVALCITISDLYMSVTLMKGADERNLDKCNQWFKIKVILLVLKILAFLFVLTISGFGSNGLLIKLPSFNLFPLYMLWVVYAFMQELKEEGRDTSDGYGATQLP